MIVALIEHCVLSIGAGSLVTACRSSVRMSLPDLILNLLLSLVGSAYLLYGRKQGSLLPMLCGLLLLVAPYLVPGLLPQLLAGIGLAALPIIRR